MHRREFLQYINTLGIGAVAPITSERALRVGIVAVGYGGCEILAGLAGCIPHIQRTVAINTISANIYTWWPESDKRIRVAGTQGTTPRSHADRRREVRRNAELAIPEIIEAVAGLDRVLLVAGMGGVTGTVISPIVAQVLREQGIFSMVFPTLPFEYEGALRMQIAQAGVRELKGYADFMYPISNEAMAAVVGDDAPLDDVFKLVPLEVQRVYRRVTT